MARRATTGHSNGDIRHASTSSESRDFSTSASDGDVPSVQKRNEDDHDGHERPHQRLRHDQESASPASAGRGRKPISEKRRQQNKKAQATFRQRKEQHVHDLESQVAELQSRSVANESENASLRDIIAQLRDENARLAATTTEPTIPTISSSSVTLNSVASDAFQNSFLATMTGYGSLPTDVTPSYLAAPPLPLPLPAASTAPDFSVWREGSPLDAFPTSNTFAGLDEFLSLDALADGTAIPTWPSGPSSSSSEPRTPGDSGKPTAFDVENFCAEFRSKAQCSEAAKRVLEDADEADRRIFEHLRPSATPEPTAT